MNRNIASDAGIEISKILGAGLVGRGKIFYAAKAASDWAAEMQPKIDKDYFFNSSTAVQDAVYATKDKRGDVVIVGPGKMQESVIVGSRTAGSNKAGVKIIAAVHGWETQVRMGDAATKNGAYTPTGGTAAGGFGFLVLSRSVEITGFLLDGGGGYSGIYVGDGYSALSSSWDENSASAWIHGNSFRGGTEGIYGMVLDGCSSDVRVTDNLFEQQTIAGIYITPGGSRTVQRPLIARNDFVDSAGYGIDMYSSATTTGVLMRENSFSDGVSTTMTAGIRTLGAGVHSIVGNYFACAVPMLAVATDFVSGNFYGWAGSTAAATNKYVTEANAGAEA